MQAGTEEKTHCPSHRPERTGASTPAHGTPAPFFLGECTHTHTHRNTLQMGTHSTVTTFTTGCCSHDPHHPCVLSPQIFVLVATCPVACMYHDFFITAGQGLHFICQEYINNATSVCGSIKEPTYIFIKKQSNRVLPRHHWRAW